VKVEIDYEAVQAAFIDELLRAHARGALAEAEAIERDYPGFEADVGVRHDSDDQLTVYARVRRRDGSVVVADAHLTETPGALGRKVRRLLDDAPCAEPAHGTP
jgi:hypothetical protein